MSPSPAAAAAYGEQEESSFTVDRGGGGGGAGEGGGGAHLESGGIIHSGNNYFLPQALSLAFFVCLLAVLPLLPSAWRFAQVRRSLRVNSFPGYRSAPECAFDPAVVQQAFTTKEDLEELLNRRLGPNLAVHALDVL